MTCNLDSFFRDTDLNRLFAYVMVSTKLSDKGTGGASFNFGKKLDDELFLPVRLDGGLFASIPEQKADFLIYYKKVGADKTKVVILELKSRADKNKAGKQIENTIEIINKKFKFMLPDNCDIIKVIRFYRKSPKLKKRRDDILYATEDKTIVDLLRK